MLKEVPLTPVTDPMPDAFAEFAEEGLRRSKAIRCFDFVPSSHQVMFGAIAAQPRGSFCEWGSGIGIITGLAALLGFEAIGIEINEELAAASRDLLRDFGITASIATGSYYEIHHDADLYFAYCWPGQMNAVQKQFVEAAPQHARLLICHGSEDVRCKVKVEA